MGTGRGTRLHPTGSVTYSYDGDGHRVQTVTGDGTTQFWYDDDGSVISTTGAWQRDYVYFNGRRVAYFAPSSGNQHYYWSDHLGSARVMSNSDGSSIEWEADYFPYGTKQVYNNSLDNFFLFTGDQFDYELGYNYAVAREQSPVLGRFLSPDPNQTAGFAHVGDPQSWNGYSYARNSPTVATDSNGLDYQVCSNDGTCGSVPNSIFETESGSARQNGEYFQDGQMFHFDSAGNRVDDGTYQYEGDDISSFGLDVVQAVGRNTNSTYAFIGTFAGGAILVGSGLGVTGAMDALMTGPEFETVMGPSRAVHLLGKVTNPKLRNIIKALYRVNADIGDGGTADAVRYTRETGELVGDSDHVQKAIDLSNGLKNVLKNPQLSSHDHQIAETLLRELTDALK